jgi:hypothetical protein
VGGGSCQLSGRLQLLKQRTSGAKQNEGAECDNEGFVELRHTVNVSITCSGGYVKEMNSGEPDVEISCILNVFPFSKTIMKSAQQVLVDNLHRYYVRTSAHLLGLPA